MKTAIPALMLALFLSPAVVAQTSQCSEGADCNKQKARDLLNEGVQAYRANQFDDASEKFKSASDLDPDLKTARLYLATAHVTLYVPGSPDAANLDHARQAIAAYKVVLSRDPANLPAID